MKKSELSRRISELQERFGANLISLRKENAEVSHSALWKSNVAVVKQAAELEEKIQPLQTLRSDTRAGFDSVHTRLVLLERKVEQVTPADLKAINERIVDLEEAGGLDCMIETPDRMDDDSYCPRCGRNL